jgi:hypothetical protein
MVFQGQERNSLSDVGHEFVETMRDAANNRSNRDRWAISSLILASAGEEATSLV